MHERLRMHVFGSAGTVALFGSVDPMASLTAAPLACFGGARPFTGVSATFFGDMIRGITAGTLKN
jgi:hypothetical protein